MALTNSIKVGELVTVKKTSNVRDWLIENNPDFESKGAAVTKVIDYCSVMVSGYNSPINVCHLDSKSNPSSELIEPITNSRKIDFVL